jgi:hypothetical protein
MHLAAQKVIQIDGVVPFYTEKAECGPYSLAYQSKWDIISYVSKLVRKHQGPLPALIKIRGGERKILEGISQIPFIIHPQSIYAIYMS